MFLIGATIVVMIKDVLVLALYVQRAVVIKITSMLSMNQTSNLTFAIKDIRLVK